MSHDTSTTPTIQATLTAASARLAAISESPRLDAEVLLAHCLDRPRSYLVAWSERRPAPDQTACFQALLERRLAGQPIAHLVGWREFWSLELEVTPATLIPRPDTELLVEQALARIPVEAAWEVLDLGTGSGAIAIAVARERPRCRLLATDVSAAALAVARRNAARFDLNQIEFRQGAWFEPLGGQCFDLILSNPPYIAAGDPHLTRGDLRFEPRSALAAGPDGLDDLRRIIATAPSHLKPGAGLWLEHGLEQGPAVAELLTQAGLVEVRSYRDLAGRPRVTGGHRQRGPTPG